MKKIHYLFGALFLILTVVSCDKTRTDDDLLLMNQKKTLALNIIGNVASTPVSDNGITPYIIPGENRGGNRTCTEVERAFELSSGYLTCSNKLDYGENGFNGEFPEGLNVTTDGTLVSFEMRDCIRIGEKDYKVGAVIVKGSAAANIYFYKDGILSDSGLASPVNASGRPSGLSNLTFCLVECKEPIVIAVKSQLTQTINNKKIWNYGVSSGEIFPFSGSTEWCSRLGVNTLHAGDVYELRNLFFAPFVQIGTITVTNGSNEIDEPCLIVEVDGFDNIRLLKTYLYIGPLSGLNSTSMCPDYPNWEWKQLVSSNTHTFIIPVDEI
ncbi:MAG: hypothetical protein JW894_04415 [Bacteroidales bacterium]|nr:hypothetical protein [Bacteroidales bacterium]